MAGVEALGACPGAPNRREYFSSAATGAGQDERRERNAMKWQPAVRTRTSRRHELRPAWRATHDDAAIDTILYISTYPAYRFGTGQGCFLRWARRHAASKKHKFAWQQQWRRGDSSAVRCNTPESRWKQEVRFPDLPRCLLRSQITGTGREGPKMSCAFTEYGQERDGTT